MHVRRSVVDAIVEHARREAPLECCGLLIGTGDEIVESRPARNLEASAVVYLVDPQDHFAAIRYARVRGLTILGAYHSHPRSPAQPSPTDIRDANDPDFVHVIVSLAHAEPQVAAFRIANAESIPLTLAIVA